MIVTALINNAGPICDRITFRRQEFCVFHVLSEERSAVDCIRNGHSAGELTVASSVLAAAATGMKELH
jgi:hypothetical protein